MAKLAPPPIRETIMDKLGNFNRVWVQWFIDQFNRINERIEQIVDVIEGNIPVADADGSLTDSGFSPTTLPHNVHTHESNDQGGKIDHGNALSGLTDIADHPGYVSLDGTRQMTADWNIGSNKLGIGVAPSYHIHSVKADANLTHDTRSLNTYHTFNGNIVLNSGNINQYGQFFDTRSTVVGTQVDTNRHVLYGQALTTGIVSPGESYAVFGLYSYAYHNHTTDLYILRPLFFQAKNLSSATIQYGDGVYGAVDNAGAGTIVSSMGSNCQVLNTGAGTITTAYGCNSLIEQSAGAVTTGYLFRGVYTGTIGTKWGIYLTGETKNYLSGLLGIGVDPSYDLHIQRATSPTIFLQDTTNTCQVFLRATNTIGYVGTVSNHDFRIQTNSADRVTIKNTGLIGIGITAPTYIIHITKAGAPTIHVEDTTNNVQLQMMSGNTYSLIGTVSTHPLQIVTNNTPRIGITNAGVTNIGDGGTTNYASFAADGELTLHGTARVKRHVRIAAPAWDAGSSAPTSGFLSVWPILSFDTAAADDEAHYSLICPHRMAAGTAIQVVVDWCHQAGADNGTVKWVLEYRVIEPGEDVTGATTEVNATSPGNHAQHDLVRTQLGTTGITGAVAHDIIGLRLYRNVAGDTLAVDADLLQVHFEFIMDKLGKAT